MKRRTPPPYRFPIAPPLRKKQEGLPPAALWGALFLACVLGVGGILLALSAIP